MKKFALLTALMATCWGLTAQEIITHKLNDFNQISLNGNLNVVLVPGEENSFEVTLHNTDADRFSFSTTDGKLALRLKANTRQQASADVKIIYKKIDLLDVISSSVRGEGAIVSDLFELKTGNGANVTIEVNAKDLSVTADGNSAASISGKTPYLNIAATSKSKVDARGVEARSAQVTSTLNGEVFVWATERLEAKAGSNAVIFYKGTPEIFKQSTNLMGSIEQFSY